MFRFWLKWQDSNGRKERLLIVIIPSLLVWKRCNRSRLKAGVAYSLNFTLQYRDWILNGTLPNFGRQLIKERIQFLQKN